MSIWIFDFSLRHICWNASVLEIIISFVFPRLERNSLSH